MRNRQPANRFWLAFLAGSIIMLFLCLTWSPAQGYSLARIDNITIETDNSGSGQESTPSLAASSSGMTVPADRPTWLAEQSFAYETRDDVHDASLPPEVPEPATLVLLGIGLAGASICRKVKK